MVEEIIRPALCPAPVRRTMGSRVRSQRGAAPTPTKGHGRGTLRISNHHTQRDPARSEEHTTELQSLADLVCRLLLEKEIRPHLHGRNRDLHREFVSISVDRGQLNPLAE